MTRLKGFRTLIAQVVGLAATLGTLWGFDIPPEMQKDITAGVVALWTLVNVILRAATDTAVGRRE